MIRTAFVLFSLILTVSSSRGESVDDIQAVSMINLISTPEKYHDEIVAIKGFLKEEQGILLIFFTKELATNKSYNDALTVSFSENCKMSPERKEGLNYFDQKWVTIVGRFQERGHSFSSGDLGTIVNISKIYIQE